MWRDCGIVANIIELSKPINNAQIREAFKKDDQRWSSFIVGTRFGFGILNRNNKASQKRGLYFYPHKGGFLP